MTKEPKIGIVMNTNQGGLRALTGAGDAVVAKQVTFPPTLSGSHGKAWLCDTETMRRRLKVPADEDATLAHWVIEAPWAHPVWHSYSLILLHLRPLATKRETLFYKDGATHELILHAMDPDADREAIITGTRDFGKAWLLPTNFSAQFIEVRDELAMSRVRESAVAICNHHLSPDTDFIREWAFLYGDNTMIDRPGRGRRAR